MISSFLTCRILVVSVFSLTCLQGIASADDKTDVAAAIDVLVKANSLTYSTSKTADSFGLRTEKSVRGEYAKTVGLRELVKCDDGTEYEQWTRRGIRVWRYPKIDTDTWSFQLQPHGSQLPAQAELRDALLVTDSVESLPQERSPWPDHKKAYRMVLSAEFRATYLGVMLGTRTDKATATSLTVDIAFDEHGNVELSQLTLRFEVEKDGSKVNHEWKIDTVFQDINSTTLKPTKEVLAVLEAAHPTGKSTEGK